MIEEILQETIVATLRIAAIVVPLLFLVEFFNHKYGDKLLNFFKSKKKHMPFWAAALSMLPGCNVAVAIVVFYLRGFVSLGTLVAALLATSDEAIYVFIPQGFNFIPLYVVKFAVAILAGYIIDAFYSKREKTLPDDQKISYCCSHHQHSHDTKEMFTHSLRHSLKIVLIVFVVLLSFNLVKDYGGFEDIVSSVFSNQLIAPFMAGIVGLIPGCGTSVVLATLFTEGIILFPAALTGLLVASGDAVIVLWGSEIGSKKFAKIIGLVFVVGILSGYVAQLALTL